MSQSACDDFIISKNFIFISIHSTHKLTSCVGFLAFLNSSFSRILPVPIVIESYLLRKLKVMLIGFDFTSCHFAGQSRTVDFKARETCSMFFRSERRKKISGNHEIRLSTSLARETGDDFAHLAHSTDDLTLVIENCT